MASLININIKPTLSPDPRLLSASGQGDLQTGGQLMLLRRQKSIGQFMVEARKETFTLPASVGRRVCVKMAFIHSPSYYKNKDTDEDIRTRI